MMTSFTRCWGVLALCAALAGGCAGGSDDDGAGECDLLTGDLVITEIMANPSGTDDGQEYFEIYNASSAALDLTGVTLRYAKTDGTGAKTHTMEEIVVEAGAYLVVGDVVPQLKPAHVDYGYGNDLGSLLNGGAVLSVECGGTTVDEAEYPSMEASSFDGVSFGVDGNVAPDHILNDTVENFCPATAEFVAGMFGSPGESNEPCNIVVPGMCSDGGTMRATVSPAAGDLVITEVLANPGGLPDTSNADAGKEWFEVFVASEVDLNGVVAGLVTGAPKLSIADPECVRVPAGTYVLFASTDDVALNGGLEGVDQTFNFTLGNSDTNGTLFVGIGDTVLDAVTWDGTREKFSTGLGPGSIDPTANDDLANWCEAEDTATYGDGANHGTPGAENPACAVVCDEGQCFDGDGCRAIDPPTEGQIRVTETLANPEGDEPNREWLELTALSEFDLAGVQIGKDGLLSAVIETDGECATVANGDRVVVAHTGNDDLPAFDFLTGLGLNNSSGSSAVVGFGDVVLDTFTYSTSTEGKARQLDPDGTTVCSSPETTPYTPGATTCGGANGDPAAGNCGTPGEANPECP